MTTSPPSVLPTSEVTTIDATTKDADRWHYPSLTKPESDGFYCYHIQRRISALFSVRLAGRIGANTATGVDLIFGVAAVLMVLFDHWLWGVVMIQLFGIFSCVDGEIARIQGCSSRIGDFLDTLTDRGTEMLLVSAIAFSLGDRLEDSSSVLLAGFALLGGVFMLTTSSEKFRSTWQKGYPKRRLENLFGLICAGSDIRLLLLSIGLVLSELTGNSSFLLWLLWALAAAVYVNFLVRIVIIYRHFGSSNPPES